LEVFPPNPKPNNSVHVLTSCIEGRNQAKDSLAVQSLIFATV
jgi:hypothetical protein